MIETDNKKHAKLLQFVTGTCRVPVGDLAELMGELSCGKINKKLNTTTKFNRIFPIGSTTKVG